MNGEDFETPKTFEQCSLHCNLIKEIGVIKDLEVKVAKKLDKATSAFLCLIGIVGIDTIVLLWNFIIKPVTDLAISK
jgi:hypothetical protein